MPVQDPERLTSSFGAPQEVFDQGRADRPRPGTHRNAMCRRPTQGILYGEATGLGSLESM